jgi:hypothetical protein
MGKYLSISSYIRKPSLIYDFYRQIYPTNSMNTWQQITKMPKFIAFERTFPENQPYTVLPVCKNFK